MKSRLNKGFTLIELLVVIAIIGLLSSIVISSLATARLKGKDASIKQQMSQLRNLLELNKIDYDSYAQLQPNTWFNTAGSCASNIPGGNYYNQAVTICNAIYALNANDPNNFMGNNYSMYMGEQTANNNFKYSIMAWLPGKKVYYCMGSSGKSSDTTVPNNFWNQAGCYGNP
ncbi:MAG: type II secretion system protein [Patescibacteria group bacterium]